MCSFAYIIALGQKYESVNEMVYAGEAGSVTPNAYEAKSFETWAEAMRYALDNYEFPEMVEPIPRGFERPKYPRVCHARIWEEITEC